MIARILIPLLLVILLSDWYIDRRILRRFCRGLWWQRLLWWMPSILLCGSALALGLSRRFAPEDAWLLNSFLFLVGFWVMPKLVFVVCSLLGWGHCVYHHTKTNWGNLVGLLGALVVMGMTVYGSTWGFNRYTVRNEVFESKDLPQAFDGYRIVHLSDAHVGTWGNDTDGLLKQMVDDINALKPDAIVFTGDLQNVEPKEIYPFKLLLGSLKAKDGVFSVLGNHDYAYYARHASEAQQAANEQEIVDLERAMGWNVLMNAHHVVRRGSDSIVIAGMENQGRPPFPEKGNIRQTMSGVGQQAFTVMLQHDPSAWRTVILPQSNAQLTLSGHTHAMQFSVFGLSPAALLYKEWGGMYREGNRAINVSVGMGGFIPFRIGATNEIVVITLHRAAH